MTKIKSMIVCSSGYPTETDSICPFVEQIVNTYSQKGISVTVVSPQSIVKHILRGNELHPRKRVYSYKNGLPITVYQPYVLSFGTRFEKMNSFLRDISVYYTLKRKHILADICYGHFWHHAYSLYKYARKNNIPLFVVSGEAKISLHKLHKPSTIVNFLNYVKGVVCVSTKNKEESVEDGLLLDLNKCIVIPNAIDNTLFKQLDRDSLRLKFGINKDDFVVAFVGWFDSNKGVQRLSEAIEQIQNPNVKSFFIGDNRDSGNMNPSCSGILHIGRLPHNQIPKYLNAADVFVLPTLHEGCNNAIIEAMACGLPIISSDRSFNEDVLNETNSIKIDPMNVGQIAKAINTLYFDQKLRNQLSTGALITAETLTTDKRADKIIQFIESKIK